ncbi:MAG TPA: hypothetical protein VEO19_11350 [Terriglobia bacterium]|nr:hypothetical protein [Terriglobia bacterium]
MKTSELAKLLGGTLHGEEKRKIRDVAALPTAGPDDLTYAESGKSLELAPHPRQGASWCRRIAYYQATPR